MKESSLNLTHSSKIEILTVTVPPGSTQPKVQSGFPATLRIDIRKLLPIHSGSLGDIRSNRKNHFLTTAGIVTLWAKHRDCEDNQVHTQSWFMSSKAFIGSIWHFINDWCYFIWCLVSDYSGGRFIFTHI